MIEDAEHGHVGQKIDGADFDAIDFDAETFFEVFFQFVHSVGTDEVDVVILHQLASLTLVREEVLAKPNAADEDGVDDELVHKREGVEATIDDREGNEEEEIGHLSDGHTLCAIADDAEDGEESEGGADAHVARALQQEGDEHEDTDGEKDEGEIVVSSVTFGIVEEVNNYPSDEGIDSETDDEVHHGLCQL